MERGRGPLAGYQVLDLSRQTAGLYACMLLADLGARVVRIEPPQGDPLREEPEYRLLARGRLNVALDVTHPRGRAMLDRLLASSDAVVETWPSHHRSRPTLGYEEVARVNGRLVFCSITPFGEAGPMADVPGDDGTVAAHVGIYGDQGGRGEPPVFLRLPIPSYGAAFLAALGTASALYVAARTGRGQKVEVSLYAGAVAMQSGSLVVGPQVFSWTRGRPVRRGSNPVYRAYPCADGWIFVACGNQLFWTKLCVALGLEELLGDPRYEGAPWNIPPEHRPPLEETIGAILRSRPRDHWLRHLREHDVPCAPVLSRQEFVEHPQVQHNGILVEVEDPELGTCLQMGLPLSFSETPGAVGPPPAPKGRHTALVLQEAGLSAQEVQALAREGVVALTEEEGR